MNNFINKQQSLILNRKYKNPSKNLKVIGVTGSYGKTSSAHLLYHILNTSGLPTALLSSIGYIDGRNELKPEFKSDTLKAGEIHKLLTQMAESKIEYAVIEMTPENLKKNKYEGINLDSGIILNILSEDPDLKEVEELIRGKFSFIDKIKDQGVLVVNGRREIADLLRTNEDMVRKNILTSFISPSLAKDIRYYVNGTTFNLDNIEFSIPIPGHHNYMNALHTIRLAQNYIPSNKIKNALKSFTMPEGRMHILQVEPFMIVVDYASTPYMLENVLQFLSAVKPKSGDIISIIGAPGEKEKYKRGVGNIAKKYSKLVILAPQDPKTEKVADINNEIYNTAQKSGEILVERFNSHEEYELINKLNLGIRIERVWQNKEVPFIAFDADDYTGRGDAIEFGIKNAKPGDVVLISGKGEDTTLAFSSIVYQWSDIEAVKQILQNQVPS